MEYFGDLFPVVLGTLIVDLEMFGFYVGVGGVVLRADGVFRQGQFTFNVPYRELLVYFVGVVLEGCGGVGVGVDEIFNHKIVRLDDFPLSILCEGMQNGGCVPQPCAIDVGSFPFGFLLDCEHAVVVSHFPYPHKPVLYLFCFTFHYF